LFKKDYNKTFIKILRKLVIIFKQNKNKNKYFHILSQACLYFEIEMFKFNYYYVSGKDILMAFIRSMFLGISHRSF